MIIVPDRKQDFFDLALEYNFLYFLKEDFHDNWCKAPKGVDPILWYNFLSEILSTHFELRVASQGILIDILTTIPENRCNLMEVSKELSKFSKGSNRETALRLQYRLKWLLTIWENGISSEKITDWQKLIKSNFAFSLAGLPSSVQTLCVTIFFAKILLYRISNNLRSEKLETLFVLDEASVIFPKSLSKKTSLLLDYFQQARAFGIGVIFASQSMNLATEIFANTGIKVLVGGFGHGSDFSEFSSAVGLNSSQQGEIRTIQTPGSSVVKDIRYKYPFRVQIDKPHEIKNISLDTIKKISKTSHELMYSVVKSTNLNKQNITEESSVDIVDNKKLMNALKMIKLQLAHQHVFLFRNEIAMMASINGSASVASAEKEAIRQGIIKKHTISKAKTSVCFWEITDKCYKYLRKEPQVWHSKGGYLHKFCAYRIAESYEMLGYKSFIEYQHTNGKLIDLCLKKNNEIIFIEICASFPLDKEIRNIEKDLSILPYPTKFIFAITQRSMKKELEELLHNTREYLCPIKIELAGNLIEIRKNHD